MEVYNRIVYCSHPTTTDAHKTRQYSFPLSDEVQVHLELGHTAALRPRPTVDGFTHDWTVHVRGSEGRNIQHFVEKVEFHLHETFPKARRVVREPPYQVTETGYGGFVMPIDVYLRNDGEPRKIRFVYELFLGVTKSVSRSRCEKISFRDPSPQFCARLLHGGGGLTGGFDNASSSSSASDESETSVLPIPSRREEARSISSSLDKFRHAIGPVKREPSPVAGSVECVTEFSTSECRNKVNDVGLKKAARDQTIADASSRQTFLSPIKIKPTNDQDYPLSSVNSVCCGSSSSSSSMACEKKNSRIVGSDDRQMKLSNYNDGDDDDDVCIVGYTLSNQLKRKFSADKVLADDAAPRVTESRKVHERRFYQSQTKGVLSSSHHQSSAKPDSRPRHLNEIAANSVSSNAILTDSSTKLHVREDASVKSNSLSNENVRTNRFFFPPTSANALERPYEPAAVTPSKGRPDVENAFAGIRVIQPLDIPDDPCVAERSHGGGKGKPVTTVEPSFAFVKRKRGRPRKMPPETDTNKEFKAHKSGLVDDPLKLPGIQEEEEEEEEVTSRSFVPSAEMKNVGIASMKEPSSDADRAAVAKVSGVRGFGGNDDSILTGHNGVDVDDLSGADEVDFDSFCRRIDFSSTPLKRNREVEKPTKSRKPKLRIRFRQFVEQFSYDRDAEIVATPAADAAPSNPFPAPSNPFPAPGCSATGDVQSRSNPAEKSLSQNTETITTSAAKYVSMGAARHDGRLRSPPSCQHTSTTAAARNEISRSESTVNVSLKPLRNSSGDNEAATASPSPSDGPDQSRVAKGKRTSERLPSDAVGISSDQRKLQSGNHAIPGDSNAFRSNREIQRRTSVTDSIPSGVRKELAFGKKRKLDEPEDEDKENQPKRSKFSTKVSARDSTKIKGTADHHAHLSGPAAPSARPVRNRQPHVESLFRLQRQLMSIGDMAVLRRVVQIIEGTGHYRLNEATFDFDLCNLDAQTVKKLQHCLAAIST